MNKQHYCIVAIMHIVASISGMSQQGSKAAPPFDRQNITASIQCDAFPTVILYSREYIDAQGITRREWAKCFIQESDSDLLDKYQGGISHPLEFVCGPDAKKIYDFFASLYTQQQNELEEKKKSEKSE